MTVFVSCFGGGELVRRTGEFYLRGAILSHVAAYGDKYLV
jgi:hypothetical protein